MQKLYIGILKSQSVFRKINWYSEKYRLILIDINCHAETVYWYSEKSIGIQKDEMVFRKIQKYRLVLGKIFSVFRKMLIGNQKNIFGIQNQYKLQIDISLYNT